MTNETRLYGAPYSVYVRIVRLVLAEKDVSYTLVPVDVFAIDGASDANRKKHPFGKIPVLEHSDFRIYETGAIVRYLDEAFAQPSLQPENLYARADMNRILSIIDNYAYPSMVWGIYVHLRETTGTAETDPAFLTAIEQSEKIYDLMVDALGGGQTYLCGANVTLADIYLTCVIEYFTQTKTGNEMIKRHPLLDTWWQKMRSRQDYAAILNRKE